MKKTFYTVLIAFGFLLIGVQAANSYSNGAPQGHTGAPNEQSCGGSGCHNGQLTQNSPGINIIVRDASNTVVTKYIANAKYSITIDFADEMMAGAGFQATVKQNNNIVGKLGAGTGSQTVGNGGTYVTHTAPIKGPSASWKFDWTAPATTVGNVTIYTTCNAVNLNGGSSGDRPMTKSLILKDNSVSISSAKQNHITLSSYPNPAVDNLNIRIENVVNRTLVYKLYSVNGVELASGILSGSSNGIASINISNLNKGLYFYQLSDNESVIGTAKFIKE